MTSQPNKPKVYLSVSNAGSIIPITTVKRILASMNGFELIEHAGGNYTHDKLLSSDVSLVLPPKNKVLNDSKGDYFDIGKGQFEQINKFYRSKTDDSIYIITGYGSDQNGRENLKVEEFYSTKETAKNWQLHYGELETDDDPQDICIHYPFTFDTHKVELKLDYNWEGALDWVKFQGITVHEKFVGWIQEENSIAISTSKPKLLLACLKKRK
jgi:hypothetical protein